MNTYLIISIESYGHLSTIMLGTQLKFRIENIFFFWNNLFQKN